MEGGPTPTEPPHMERILIHQQTTQQAVVQSPPGPKNGVVMAILIVGSVLMLIGAAVLNGRYLIDAPSGPRTEYDRLIGLQTFAGNVLIAVGVILVALVGWHVGIARSDLPEGVRRNAVIAAAFVVAAWFVFSFITVSRFYIYP